MEERQCKQKIKKEDLLEARKFLILQGKNFQTSAAKNADTNEKSEMLCKDGLSLFKLSKTKSPT